MQFKRFWAMFIARNKEFFRDRAAFGWNFLFPFLLVVGFGIIFGGKAHTSYKIGFFPQLTAAVSIEELDLPIHRLALSRYSGHEHDVQRTLGCGICGRSVS